MRASGVMASRRWLVRILVIQDVTTLTSFAELVVDGRRRRFHSTASPAALRSIITMDPRCLSISPFRSSSCTATVTPGLVHAEHQAQELLRQRQLVLVDPVVGHKQPAGKALLDGAAAVGERCHRGLVEEVLT